MLEKLEQRTVWETLRDCPTPLALYGMGDGADKILKIMAEYGRMPDAVFASDEFVRGHSFAGYKVLKYSEVCEKYTNFTVVMAFGIHDEPMLKKIAAMNEAHPVLAPDVPVVGDGLFTRDFVTQHKNEIEFVYENLADERSKEVYLSILNFKISGKVDYLYSSFDNKNSVYRDIFYLSPQEHIVDLGAYDGDTIREILNFTGGYNWITAVEPDEKNFKKLIKTTAGMERLTLINKGVWSGPATLTFAKKAGRNSRVAPKGHQIEADSVDSFMKNEKVTLLKMDVEGCELAALEGAGKTIQRHHPHLYVCAYHRNEDLFALPLKIWELAPDYRMYFRHSPYIPAWECNFYAVDKNRMEG